MGFLRSLFGTKMPPPAPPAVVNAAVANAAVMKAPESNGSAVTLSDSMPVAAPQPTEPEDRRYFEILETYQNRLRPLHDCVTWDVDEEKRLKALRIEAYQLRNATDFQPHDVFHLWPYHPVDPDHVIKRVTLKAGTPLPLPEYTQILHVTVVSDRVMKAISTLEEGRHAFYPVEIVSSDGETRYRYYFMQFLEQADCTVPKLGGFRRGVRQDGTTYWVRSSADEKVFLDIERVGTRHLFQDKRAKWGCFISAELVAKLNDFLPRGLYLAEAGVVRKQDRAVSAEL